MQFNIITCIFLWMLVSVISSIVAMIEREKLKRKLDVKKLYMQRFVELASNGTTSSKLIKDLYYSFINHKGLRRILIKALRMRPTHGLDYIYSVLGCPPMLLLHNYVKSREKHGISQNNNPLPQDNVNYFNEQIRQWYEKCHDRMKQLRILKLKSVLGRYIILILNLIMYIKLKTEMSMWIFVIVNTIAVILSIVLDYESGVVDTRIDDGKLARAKRGKNKTQEPANGIRNFYQIAAALGLITNISMFVGSWLGPVA